MREKNKRWLLSMLKTSGSKRQYVINGSYADDRSLSKGKSFEELPARQSIKKSSQFYNGKINYGLLVRFSRRNVGNDWDSVHSEIIARIPTKLLHHKKMIYWFVADKVQIIDNRPWNKATQKFIWSGEELTKHTWPGINSNLEFREFYVDPDTNKLIRIEKYGTRRKKQ